MDDTMITKIAIIALIAVVFSLLMGFYWQFTGLLEKDEAMQAERDESIKNVFEQTYNHITGVFFFDDGLQGKL